MEPSKLEKLLIQLCSSLDEYQAKVYIDDWSGVKLFSSSRMKSQNIPSTMIVLDFKNKTWQVFNYGFHTLEDFDTIIRAKEIIQVLQFNWGFTAKGLAAK